jgi:hypothetical protein
LCLLRSESELDLTPVHSWTLVCHPQLQSQLMQTSNIQAWLKLWKLLFPKCLFHIKQTCISISSTTFLYIFQSRTWKILKMFTSITEICCYQYSF